MDKITTLMLLMVAVQGCPIGEIQEEAHCRPEKNICTVEKCFYFSPFDNKTQLRNYKDSEQYCANGGMKMVTFKSKKEYIEFRDLYFETDQSFRDDINKWAWIWTGIEKTDGKYNWENLQEIDLSGTGDIKHDYLFDESKDNPFYIGFMNDNIHWYNAASVNVSDCRVLCAIKTKNKCETNENDCHNFATCTQMGTTYSCKCEKPYEGNGTFCSAINRCLTNTNDCDENAHCVQNKTTFICTCKKGYKGNGTHCTDIDECLTKNGDCSHFCVNHDGFYECRCLNGFTTQSDAKTCGVNIDNCGDDNGNCSHYCRNPGNFTCFCPIGFELLQDHLTCQVSLITIGSSLAAVILCLFLVAMYLGLKTDVFIRTEDIELKEKHAALPAIGDDDNYTDIGGAYENPDKNQRDKLYEDFGYKIFTPSNIYEVDNQENSHTNYRHYSF